MEVEWKTIEVIAQTQAIDLWILFPLGQAVNRLLTKKRIPEGTLAGRLNKFFGTDDWKEAFYKKEYQQTYLFDLEPVAVKTAGFDSIGKYFINRLKSLFINVADNPLPLCNSKNVPTYLLCFAASNPKGAPIAVKIAQHILGE
jgi:three-Cys-motif partner protein